MRSPNLGSSFLSFKFSPTLTVRLPLSDCHWHYWQWQWQLKFKFSAAEVPKEAKRRVAGSLNYRPPRYSNIGY